MQPSSDRTDSGNPALRRWGPLAAIVVVVAVIAGVVILGGGDDDETAGPAAEEQTGDGDGGTEELTSTGEPPEGAISWTAAEEQGLDVTFPDTCDPETGRLAMPYYFAPECFADADPVTVDGTRGVTDDSVKVVVYLSQDDDPVMNFITAPIANDDTAADARATYEGFTEMFNEFAQTYGRTVELEFLIGSGFVTDEVAARSDAVRAIEEMGAFAVWGGPALSNAWTEEIHARGGICIGCPAIAEPDPSVFSVTASADQTRAHLVEYIDKKLAGKPAIHAGDEAFHDTERVFGQLYIDTGSAEAREGAQKTRQALSDIGVELAEQIGYELDPSSMQEQAGSAVARMKAAGVTTVIFSPGDPIAPASFTREASDQDWYPEWLLGGSALIDTSAFGRTYDQSQWQNAFGISSLGARVTAEEGTSFVLYDWYHGRYPEADDTAPVLWPQPALFFSGLQAAGPELTVENYQRGLFSLNVLGRAVTQPTLTFGQRGIWEPSDYFDPDDGDDFVDYWGIDDFTEIWWDPDAEGLDEIFNEGAGMYRFVDGGHRYLPGEWTDELKVFDEEGSVTIYDEIPEGERPGEYPSPR